ncbi:MAG: S41 family peptidase [Candidatus Pacebacteria bacterium]|nr:S41 family peptidase [Candidatus Paceibacterota bacterium]
MQNNRKSLVLMATLLVISFGFGFNYGRNSLPSQGGAKDIFGLVKGDKSVVEENADFGVFWEAWDLIEKNYILGPLNRQKMVYGAVTGMVDSLGDPYSTFLTPEENSALNDDLKGVFGGIGAEVGYREEAITIIAPLKNSPAEKAGLMAGDQIVGVDNKSTEGLNVDEVVEMIRGEKGVSVKIAVVRGEETLTFDIVRDTIVDKTVRWEMKEGQVAYIEITQFKQDTATELDAQIGDILAQDPKSVALDLRNNPGGYLNVVVDVASRFIDEGQIVVTEESGESNQVYKASGGKRFSNLPIVVLVNEGSASAAEILAGALKDHHLGTLVGKQTFGKGLVQGISELQDGSALKITVAKWLTPDGNNINKDGIAPDVEVEYTMDDFKAGKDPQLDKALEILRANNQ